MQSSFGITNTEAKIPLYRAFRAIATAEQVDVDEIEERVEEAIAQATEPLLTAVDNLPEIIGASVADALQPVVVSLDLVAQTVVAAQGLLQEIYSEVVTPEDDDDVLDDDVSESCILDVFEFMRSLNQIDDLIADQKFTEPRTKKNNSERLKNYRDRETKTYTGCIAILERRRDAGQLDDDTKNALEEEFSLLFNEIDDDSRARAQRLLDVQAFRRRILDFFFFSSECQQEQPVELVEPEQPSIT